MVCRQGCAIAHNPATHTTSDLAIPMVDGAGTKAKARLAGGA